MMRNCWLIKVDNCSGVCGGCKVRLDGRFAINPGDLLIFYVVDWSNNRIACCAACAVDVNYQSSIWGTVTAITLGKCTSLKVNLSGILPKNFAPASTGVTPLGAFCGRVIGGLDIWALTC
ncbi:hypothetical protein Vsou_09000 [Vulcanisaeta souniana JCM 11219]|uniref:Uncharacterized protein n=2 Tax=Vulcanisaeta souniana TaxID=164452 RepID=A0ABN6SS23_9CREN|nr:hypothetical protein Vsou_09000 [Vulcanisaeta souniana JCM 11219]